MGLRVNKYLSALFRENLLEQNFMTITRYEMHRASVTAITPLNIFFLDFNMTCPVTCTTQGPPSFFAMHCLDIRYNNSFMTFMSDNSEKQKYTSMHSQRCMVQTGIVSKM